MVDCVLVSTPEELFDGLLFPFVLGCLVGCGAGGEIWEKGAPPFVIGGHVG